MAATYRVGTAVVEIGCPHCTGVGGTCCVCGGTRRARSSPGHLTWLWEYADCRCAACIAAGKIRAAYDRTPAPTRPNFQPWPAHSKPSEPKKAAA